MPNLKVAGRSGVGVGPREDDIVVGVQIPKLGLLQMGIAYRSSLSNIQAIEFLTSSLMTYILTRWPIMPMSMDAYTPREEPSSKMNALEKEFVAGPRILGLVKSYESCPLYIRVVICQCRQTMEGTIECTPN